MMTLAILVGSLLAARALAEAGKQTAAANAAKAADARGLPTPEIRTFQVEDTLPVTNRATVTDYSVNLASAFNIYSNLRKVGEFPEGDAVPATTTVDASRSGLGSGGAGVPHGGRVGGAGGPFTQ